MAAKRKVGRPTKYNKLMLDKAKKFLEQEDRPTWEQLAVKLRVNRKTIYDWRDANPDFSDILEEMHAKYEQNIAEGALTGEFNATFAKFLLSAKLGMREKSEVTQEHTGDVGLSICFNTVNPSNYKPE